jgi:hypothetical protein
VIEGCSAGAGGGLAVFDECSIERTTLYKNQSPVVCCGLIGCADVLRTIVLPWDAQSTTTIWLTATTTAATPIPSTPM